MKRNILVTGATRGLGLSIARRLIDDGYFVVAAGRRPSEAIERLLTDHPGGGSFARLDLKETDGLQGFCRAVTRAHGPLYGLVNNAAVAHAGVLATMHEAEIAEMVQVNVLGTILLTKYALRPMLLQREGRVVNIASIIATTGFNGLSVYGASKAALIGFTRSLAREVGRAGITANAIAPGYMETDMTRALQGDKLALIRRRSSLRRLAGTEDVAGAAAYLLGPDAAMVTGTVVTVDAGSTA